MLQNAMTPRENTVLQNIFSDMICINVFLEVDYHIIRSTVKHVCNDHLYNKIYYLWFIQ